MIEPSLRLPPTERQVRHHEVDIEPHAHPGEPRQSRFSDHETVWREPLPRFTRETRRVERPGAAARNRY